MNTINDPPARQYFVASDTGTVISYGYVDPGQRVDSGAPTFETFDTLDAYNARLLAAGVQPEDLWSGTLPADPTQAGLILKARVNSLREDKLVLPVTFMGHPFQSGTQTLIDLSGLITLVRAGVPLPNDFTWRAADNVNVPMDISGLVGFGATLLVYRNSCFNRSWALKAEIDASSTPGDIDLQAGWPDNTNP